MRRGANTGRTGGIRRRIGLRPETSTPRLRDAAGAVWRVGAAAAREGGGGAAALQRGVRLVSGADCRRQAGPRRSRSRRKFKKPARSTCATPKPGRFAGRQAAFARRAYQHAPGRGRWGLESGNEREEAAVAEADAVLRAEGEPATDPDEVVVTDAVAEDIPAHGANLGIELRPRR